MRNPNLFGPIPDQGAQELANMTGRSLSMDNSQEPGPVYRFQGLVTYEKPIKEWFGDIVLTPGQSNLLRSGIELPTNCVNIRFIDVVGAPTVQINGQGPRKILNLDSLTNTEIQTLVVFVGGAETCTVQSAGTGD